MAGARAVKGIRKIMASSDWCFSGVEKVLWWHGGWRGSRLVSGRPVGADADEDACRQEME